MQPEVLLKLDSYKKSDYGIAIAEAYYNIDDLLTTEQGQADLKIFAGIGSSKPKGLFADIEDKLESGEINTPPPPESNPLANDQTPSSDGNNIIDNNSKKNLSKKLTRVNSSDEFLRSALARNSIVIPVDAMNQPTTSKDSIVGAKPMVPDRHDTNDDDEEDADAQPGSHDATGMGCTALSVIIRGRSVVVANTGDSRCVISRRGEATPLTLDHKPVIYEEAQRIIRAGGFVRDNRVNGALNVSRTIGDLDFKKNEDLPHTEQMVVATPDITELEIKEGDEFLILACDGIWDVMSNQEAVDFVRKKLKSGYPLKAICEAMCDFCLAPDLKGLCRGADNMSVIVVFFKETAKMDSIWSKIGQFFLLPLKMFK